MLRRNLYPNPELSENGRRPGQYRATVKLEGGKAVITGTGEGSNANITVTGLETGQQYVFSCLIDGETGTGFLTMFDGTDNCTIGSGSSSNVSSTQPVVHRFTAPDSTHTVRAHFNVAAGKTCTFSQPSIELAETYDAAMNGGGCGSSAGTRCPCPDASGEAGGRR